MNFDASPVTHRRNIMYPRLEFRTGKLELILPIHADEKEILEKYHEWIAEKNTFIQEMLDMAETLPFENRTKEELMQLVKGFPETRRHADVLIKFRKMSTKWASCSKNRTITLNSLTQYLPEYHLEYILSHEFLHLTIRQHNTLFKDILLRQFPDMERLERELCGYWFKLNVSK